MPHQALVPDRNEDRHEHIIREVVHGLRAVVVDGELDDVERRGELAGVEGFGHCLCCFDAFRKAPVLSLFCFTELAQGHEKTLRCSTGRQAGKRERVTERKRGFVFRCNALCRPRRGGKK